MNCKKQSDLSVNNDITGNSVPKKKPYTAPSIISIEPMEAVAYSCTDLSVKFQGFCDNIFEPGSQS